MRQRVDQHRIELFLQQLGRQFTKPGRVYLVGGNEEILPRYATESLKHDPAEFQRKFTALTEMWQDISVNMDS